MSIRERDFYCRIVTIARSSHQPATISDNENSRVHQNILATSSQILHMQGLLPEYCMYTGRDDHLNLRLIRPVTHDLSFVRVQSIRHSDSDVPTWFEICETVLRRHERGAVIEVFPHMLS